MEITSTDITENISAKAALVALEATTIAKRNIAGDIVSDTISCMTPELRLILNIESTAEQIAK